MRSRQRQAFDQHGYIHFVTSSTRDRAKVFVSEFARGVFCDTLRFYIDRGDFTLLAWVLMPNHFHLVLKRSEKHTISQIVGNIKRYTARVIRDEFRREKQLPPCLAQSLWQPRFDAFLITSLDTLRQKIAYIHNNPVRSQLAPVSDAWPFSSAGAYAGKGHCRLPVDIAWRCLD